MKFHEHVTDPEGAVWLVCGQYVSLYDTDVGHRGRGIQAAQLYQEFFSQDTKKPSVHVLRILCVNRRRWVAQRHDGAHDMPAASDLNYFYMHNVSGLIRHLVANPGSSHPRSRTPDATLLRQVIDARYALDDVHRVIRILSQNKKGPLVVPDS